MGEIETKHRPIAHMFGSGAGLRLMRRDSDMTEHLLLRLAKRGMSHPPYPRQLHCPGPQHRCSVYSNGRYCGRRVASLYAAGELFACRRCYGLAYASQQESAHHRGLGKAQKIRMRLGGSPNMLDEFPDKPKHMHWLTYDRLRRSHDIAEQRSTIGLMRVCRIG